MTCPICNRDTTSTCHRCIHRMRRHLTDIPTNYLTAKHQLTPGKSDGRSNERSIGVRITALDFLAGNDVLRTLEDWERDWRTFFQLTPFGEATAQRAVSHAKQRNNNTEYDGTYLQLNACVTFLDSWLDKAAQSHPAITDFAQELRDQWRISQHAANIHPPNTWLVTCPATLDNTDCGNKLHITGQDFDTTITCRRCHTPWPVERLLRVAASDSQAEIWLAPEDAAHLFGIHISTLKRWARRGHIKKAHGQYEHHSIRDAITGVIT